MTGPRFLIIRIAALGDIAVTTGLLNRILAEHPGARVTWLCDEAAEPLVRLFSGVDEILTVSARRLLRGSRLAQLRAIASTWRKLAFRAFDHVLLVHADRRYRILTWPLVGARIVALEHGVNPLLARYRGDEYARLLDGPETRGPITHGYQLADVRDNLPATLRRTANSRVVVLVPGGARNVLREDSLRRWPVENYRHLADRLLAAGYEVVLVGDADDIHVRRHFDGLDVTDRIGELTLVDTLCALRDADVLVSHDTGPLHLARLVRTPAVALFGPTDPRHVVGKSDDVNAIWGGSALACRPCYDGRNYAACADNLCMKDISVDEVVRAVAARLATIRHDVRRGVIVI